MPEVGLLYKADGGWDYDWIKQAGSREAGLRLASEEVNWPRKEAEIRC